jgi:hypothetical protein
MSADQDISQNSRKAKQSGPDARVSDRKMRETGIISYHHAVLRNLTAYFALGGVIVDTGGEFIGGVWRRRLTT